MCILVSHVPALSHKTSGGAYYKNCCGPSHNALPYCSSNAGHWTRGVQKVALSYFHTMLSVFVNDVFSKVKVVSSLCLSKNSDRLYLGTDNGDLCTLDVLSFKLINGVVKHEAIVQGYVYEDYCKLWHFWVIKWLPEANSHCCRYNESLLTVSYCWSHSQKLTTIFEMIVGIMVSLQRLSPLYGKYFFTVW